MGGVLVSSTHFVDHDYEDVKRAARMIYRITKRTKELEPMMNGDEEKENLIHDEYTRPDSNQRRRHSLARTIPARLLRTSHDSRPFLFLRSGLLEGNSRTYDQS